MINRVSVWLNENEMGTVVRSEPLTGGSINRASRLVLDRGPALVLKENDGMPEDFFTAEAAGLAALQQTGSVRTPEVVHVESDYILLEDLGQSSKRESFWQELGTALATLHSNQQAKFGFPLDNYCGATRQVNTLSSDGYTFFAEYRLMTLARQADDAGLLERAVTRRIESLCSRLDQLIPAQPAALLHGDLWSGNIHCCETGQAAVIDPAAYYGWPEAELAMTQLFGQFDGACYEAYQATTKIEPDWSDRADLYNLYHLLNHLLMFGGSYLAPINETIKRYAN